MGQGATPLSLNQLSGRGAQDSLASFCPEHGQRYPPATADVDPVEAAAAPVTQPNRVGAQGESPLLAAFHDGNPATAGTQKIRSSIAIGQMCVGAHEKYEARLVVASGRNLRNAVEAAQVARNLI